MGILQNPPTKCWWNSGRSLRSEHNESRLLVPVMSDRISWHAVASWNLLRLQHSPVQRDFHSTFTTWAKKPWHILEISFLYILENSPEKQHLYLKCVKLWLFVKWFVQGHDSWNPVTSSKVENFAMWPGGERKQTASHSFTKLYPLVI
jgi:hypothetical protein